MIWFEAHNLNGFPAQTLSEGIEYYTHKYRQTPNRAQLPIGTELTALSADYQEMYLETSQLVLPRHLHLTYDLKFTE
jgi:hypothetical protein